MVHKIRSGQPVEIAVEDIISRCTSEIRKNAFGDDIDDAKNLPWTREQAWAVIKQLSKVGEVNSWHENVRLQNISLIDRNRFPIMRLLWNSRSRVTRQLYGIWNMQNLSPLERVMVS